MNESRRDRVGQFTMKLQRGCVQCALELGQEVPMTFYQAFCEGCCKNGEPVKMNDGLRAFQSMDSYEQSKNLEILKRRIAVMLEQYEASLQIYGKKVQEDLKRKRAARDYERVEAQCLDCLSGILSGGGSRAEAELPPEDRKGGVR